MFFHWLKDYGKAKRHARRVVDSIFADAAAASPEVFDGDSRKERVQHAKFEHMCPWAALTIMKMDGPQAQPVLEALVDRIEVGLRENGVGDMKVGVHVRKYASALNGRIRRYASMLDARDWDGLVKALNEHGIDSRMAEKMRARCG